LKIIVRYLSSIRAPRADGKAEQPYGRDAKEWLRKKLIGKRVQVVVEYVRSAPEERVFVSVFHNKINLAEGLVAAGLVEVVRHRMDEDRSLHYDALLAAETTAKAHKLALHSGKPPAPYTVVDLSLRPRAPAGAAAADVEAANVQARANVLFIHLLHILLIYFVYTRCCRRARQRFVCTFCLYILYVYCLYILLQARAISAKAKSYLPFLLKSGATRAIVDYVANGARYKVLVPKENCIIALCLAGIKCPQAARVGAGGGGAEPYGEDAARFARALCLQQDVTIEVDAMDKGDNFLGAVYVNGRTNVAVELVKAGTRQRFVYTFC
jgi:endonuclease YncB( thermonuclease family)